MQRPIGEAFAREYSLATVKHPPKIHVWACFASAGVGRIHCFTENLDAKLYKDILKEHLMQSANTTAGLRVVPEPPNEGAVLAGG